MIPLTLEQVERATGGALGGGADPATMVTGVSTDTRTVAQGDLFVAVVGERVDAHDLAADAVAAGAAAVLASRSVPVPHVLVDDTVGALGRLAHVVLVDHPSVVVVGVTGSSGKTSTKDLLAQLLPAYGPTVAPAGSLNTEVGLPVTALGIAEQTRVLVAEMGARGVGHVRYLCGVAPPRIGVVLNVGTAHVGEFGSRENIALAKGELVECLPPAARGGVAVLNADDPLVAAMASRTTARVMTYGETAGATVRGTEVELDDAGRASFAIVVGGRRADVRLGLHGRHHVSNALAAAAVALALGVDLEQVAAGLSQARPASRWRMEVSTAPSGATVVNDAYNANPDSVRAALEALAAMTRDGRRGTAVLGEMFELGETTVDLHEETGREAARLGAARLLAVGTTEPVAALVRGFSEESGRPGDAVAVPDQDAALDALQGLGPDDVVLVKASRSAGLEGLATALTEVAS